MKSAIEALRACNRFGMGKKAFITRLPSEVVKLIEERMLYDTRSSAVEEWDTPFRCYEDRCTPSDQICSHMHEDLMDLAMERKIDRVYNQRAESGSDEDSDCDSDISEVSENEPLPALTAATNFKFTDISLHAIWQQFLHSIHESNPREVFEDYSAPAGRLDASTIHFLHWPPKYGRHFDFGTILDSSSDTISFLKDTFPDCGSQLFFDLFCKAKSWTGPDGKRLSDEALYGNDPEVGIHFDLCR